MSGHDKAGENGHEWERRPVRVPLWWLLMVSSTLIVVAVSGVLMIRAYGASLQTVGSSLTVPWPFPASVTRHPSEPSRAATPAPSQVGNALPPSEAPLQEQAFPSGPIPGITVGSVKTALEQKGVHCDEASASSSGLNCTLPDSRLYTEVGASGPDSAHVWLVSCHIYFAYVDTPPNQQEMLRCFDAVIAAATPGTDMESNRAWIRTHIADGALATTRDGIVTLLFDPRRGTLEIEGGL